MSRAVALVVVFVVTAAVMLGGVDMRCADGSAQHSGSCSAAAETLGWRLGVQAYSFKNFTFFEAVDKAASMGMKYIEAYSRQRLSKDDDATTHYTMSGETRRKMLDKLDAAGVKLVCYGVVTGQDEADWRKIFEFAKAMGIETIISEPKPEHMDLVENLCEEFGINVAIHNHPKPSHYWNPDTVLDAVRGRSKRIGACADTGHWMRSGLDPLECLQKLEGRIVSFHFKDLDKIEPPDISKRERTAHDVPWGTGAGNVYGMLSEIRRQKFRGVFSVEYEYNWDNSVPEIQQSAEYFNLIAAALDKEGYRPLFKEDLSDALYPEGSWVVENGVLAAKDRGDIWTKARYGDFVLSLEFKCDPETNSGVFLRCTDTVEWLHTSIEVQILQPTESNPKHNCGGIFDCLAPSKLMVKKPGKWNKYTIIAKANKIYVMLNGEQVVNMDLDLWTEAHKNPDGTPNKFNTAYKDMAREGHIGLQYHGHPVWFRNLEVKPL